MARTPYSAANACCWSMLTLPILTCPAHSAASSSSTGAIILQGPHHSAQKSTSTGVEAFSTSSAKFSCVKFTILGAAINKWERNKTQVDCTNKFKPVAPALQTSSRISGRSQIRKKLPEIDRAPYCCQSNDRCRNCQDRV